MDMKNMEIALLRLSIYFKFSLMCSNRKGKHCPSPCRKGMTLKEGMPLQKRGVSGTTWLILPVVIRLSQRLSHACLSINLVL